VNDQQIDELLAPTDQVDPVLLTRVQTSITSSLQPVQPMPPVWALALILFAISLVASVGSAAWLGFAKLNPTATIPVLAVLTWLAALVSVSQMIPGGQPWKNPTLMEPVMTNPPVLLAVSIIAWLIIGATLFRGDANNLHQGAVCLTAGLIVAAPTGILTWLTLRRGFAVNPANAALAAGTLAGLAGLTALELHCPLLGATHILIWHTAVIAISALIPYAVIVGQRHALPKP
jgi:hypothetical protein